MTKLPKAPAKSFYSHRELRSGYSHEFSTKSFACVGIPLSAKKIPGAVLEKRNRKEISVVFRFVEFSGGINSTFISLRLICKEKNLY